MKIPEHAKKVFEGVIFDVYQWEQEMFDGSKATFECLKRPATVVIIPLMDGQVTLIKEQQPRTCERMTIPGGRQEKGEEPSETAKRELKEEIGLVSEDWELICTYEPSGKIDWQIYVYVARDCKKVSEPNLDAGEKIRMMEFDIDTAIAEILKRDFWDRALSDDLLRMQSEGRLDEFKERLLSG